MKESLSYQHFTFKIQKHAHSFKQRLLSGHKCKHLIDNSKVWKR